jgi:hypothetical protein
MNNFVVHFHDENFVGKVMNVTAPSKDAVRHVIIVEKENDYMQDIEVWQGSILNAPTYSLAEFKTVIETQNNGCNAH